MVMKVIISCVTAKNVLQIPTIELLDKLDRFYNFSIWYMVSTK